MSSLTETLRVQTVRSYAPGFVLAAIVALAAAALEPLSRQLGGLFSAGRVGVPAPVLALIVGVVLHSLAERKVFQPGLLFCVKRLLRIAIALLGIRIALSDIVGLGLGTAALVVVAMALTVLSGFGLARLFNQSPAYGALAGVATAVCGASAALATASVLPDYKGKETDTVFVVVAVNALSTLAILLYPPLCALLGLDVHQTGIMLGGTIHDVAQVVASGYSVSDTAGDVSVIVKLFRVFMLLPCVVLVAWWFARGGAKTGEARVPVPVFALVFLALALLNSTGLVPLPIKTIMLEFSKWGLLIAIAALGLGTSVTAMARLGWRHMATVIGTTLVILVLVTGGLMLTV